MIVDKAVSKFLTSVGRFGRSGLNARFLSSVEAPSFLRRDVRRRDVLPKNPNRWGPLFDGPDYTYLDGRPTPYGSRQVKRMDKQKEYTAKIIQFTREVDTAKSTHKRHLMEKEQEVKNILSSKLKPKGKKVLGS